MNKLLLILIILLFTLVTHLELRSQNITFYPNNTVLIQQKINSNILILPSYCYDISVENNKIVETTKSNIVDENLLEELIKVEKEIEKIDEEIHNVELEIEKIKNSIKLIESILTSTTKDQKEINQLIEKFNDLQNKHSIANIKLYSLYIEKKRKEELKVILQEKTNQNSIEVKIVKLLTNTGNISYKVNGKWETVYSIDYDKSTLSVKAKLSLPDNFKLKVSKVTITTVDPIPETLDTKLPKLVASVMEKLYKSHIFKTMTVTKNQDIEDNLEEQKSLREIQDILGLTWEVEKDIVIENGTEITFFEKLPSSITKKYLAIPSKSKYGIVTISISNTSEMILPPGRVEVITSKNKIQAGRVNSAVFRNENFETLGIPIKEITVTKKLVEEKTENPKLLGTNKRVIKVFKTIIKNNLPYDVNIKVVDRIPVPNDDRVKISIDNIHPQPLEKLEEIKKNGIFSLQTNIKSGSSFTLDLAYSVEYPANLVYYEYEVE